ncbi:MAG: UDP-N-acetylmuramate dehydrogenase [Anaerovoracaceae bacterium]
MKETIKDFVEILDEDRIIADADMREFTSFKAGGKAKILVTPNSVEELKAILVYLDEKNINHMIIGNGSNILVKDGGFDGVMVKIGQGFDSVIVNGDEITAGAGALLSVVAKTAQRESLAGMEFASGIPGSMGGAAFMNAGAYGGEMKDIITQVRVVSKDGREDKIMSLEELELGYRHSKLYDTLDIVVSVTMKLRKGNKTEILDEMKELNKKRNTKQPVNYPSAGSFFKRPEGYFAGKLVQDANLKGVTVGGAQVSELHSGFVINIGDATATDIINLMHIVQGVVMKEFGVMLQPEVRIIGEDSEL